MLGSLLAIAVVVIGGFFALRAVAIDEAEEAIRQQVKIEGGLVEAAGLTDGVLRSDPAAMAKLDAVVFGRILNESVMRVKIWSRSGRVLYSDQPAIIGRQYGLGEDEQRLFLEGGAEAELSDLSKPENRYERPEGKLLEAHTAIRTPNGTQVLFEVYERFDSVSASGERLLRALAPPLLAGLLVLLLFQVPLAWSMASRLQRGHRERESLLAGTIEASERERRNIAAGLHDGVVQDLAGVAFGLAPVAESADRRGDFDESSAVRGAIERLREGIRSLRTLLVEIHPPNLESAGLESALTDLLSPLAAEGIKADLRFDEGVPNGPAVDPLLYRVANEAIRNVRAHSGATKVEVEVTSPVPGQVGLVVEDDGVGFSDVEREASAAEFHVGLRLLEGLVLEAGGELDVDSEPGRGTRVELRIPAE